VNETREKMYYSISEVARLADVKAHVLRYWETEFPSLAPPKNRAGNRTYRPQDVKMVLAIKKLLYDQGHTIIGARQKLVSEKGSALGQAEIPFSEGKKKEKMRALRDGLREVMGLLDEAP
jgi:DNA-binding transcriptional MerR regulator